MTCKWVSIPSRVKPSLGISDTELVAQRDSWGSVDEKGTSDAMFTVFLDRDGVINRNRTDYVKQWSEFRFLPGALRAIADLTAAGYQLFVVTNQACIGKGLLSHADLDELHQRMLHEIEWAGGHIAGTFYCPHRSDEGCHCRKPAPGLLLRARDEYGVDLRQAIMVGDSMTDINAAAAVGVPAILVLSGLGRQTALHAPRDSTASWQPALNLAHAASIIRRCNVAANTLRASTAARWG
jgi:D-glycero-D-manno-heptose 1,7-bisphosphate phosphatase